MYKICVVDHTHASVLAVRRLVDNVRRNKVPQSSSRIELPALCALKLKLYNICTALIVIENKLPIIFCGEEYVLKVCRTSISSCINNLILGIKMSCDLIFKTSIKKIKANKKYWSVIMVIRTRCYVQFAITWFGMILCTWHGGKNIPGTVTVPITVHSHIYVINIVNN